MFSKKGQSAVEYLVTYGWAFIAILATVGVLSYFGLLNPARYIPDSCEFGQQLQCQDHFIDDSAQITLRLKNNFEAPIYITDVTGADLQAWPGPAIQIGVGEIRRVDIPVDTAARPVIPGDKESFELTIEFQRDNEVDVPPVLATPTHDVSGKVFAEIQDATLGLLP